jgi:hypothetical protein
LAFAGRPWKDEFLSRVVESLGCLARLDDSGVPGANVVDFLGSELRYSAAAAAAVDDDAPGLELDLLGLGVFEFVLELMGTRGPSSSALRLRLPSAAAAADDDDDPCCSTRGIAADAYTVQYSRHHDSTPPQHSRAEQSRASDTTTGTVPYV